MKLSGKLKLINLNIIDLQNPNRKNDGIKTIPNLNYYFTKKIK